MAIDVEKLEASPNWIKELKISNLESTAKAVEYLYENESNAYSIQEIEDEIDGEYISRRDLNSLVTEDVLERMSGMYYIKESDKARQIIDLCLE